jgi:predicted Zn-dependent protease
MPRLRWAIAAVVSGAVLSALACAVNPATGERELMLVSESQEIQMGLQADPAIVSQFGIYEDEGLQQYLDQIGKKMAARSERPDLPWTFRLVDDPVINAFAVPGGFIYITRGILAYFNSEAELASVVGHEIGHVTARHSAQQMSQQQLAQIGLIAGAVLVPDEYSELVLGVGGAGMQLLFLKFSRDDERQSDDLGMRYMVRAGYDASEMPGVYTMLSRVSTAGGGERIPEWQSTHPNPENREQRMLAHLDTLRNNGTIVNQDGYLQRLHGLVYGPNPRQGFFRDAEFVHPDLAFRVGFPAGWKTANYAAGVVAQSPNGDASMQLTLSEITTADAAARSLAQEEGLQAGTVQAITVNGLPGATLPFAVTQDDGTVIRGVATFVEYGGRVFQQTGITTSAAWSGYQSAITASHRSFAALTDQRLLAVQPLTLSIIRLDRGMTLAEFHRRYPSQVDVERLALLNGVEVGTMLPEGRLVKRVVGGPLP